MWRAWLVALVATVAPILGGVVPPDHPRLALGGPAAFVAPARAPHVQKYASGGGSRGLCGRAGGTWAPTAACRGPLGRSRSGGALLRGLAPRLGGERASTCCGLRLKENMPLSLGMVLDTERPSEEIGELISKGTLSVSVREAKHGEGDAVALLRCRAFGQGKEVFRSQLLKMVHGGGSRGAGIVGGRSRTSFLVSVVDVVEEDSKTLALNLILADLDQLLEDNWITRLEYSTRRRRLLAEGRKHIEVVIGSADAAVHEFVSEDLSLTKAVYISSMAVRDGFRKRGVGAALLRGALDLSRKIRGVKNIFLHVEEDNEAAIRLYTAAGFKRADASHPGTSYMDKALRLMLQVPVNAQLYCTTVSGEGPIHKS